MDGQADDLARKPDIRNSLKHFGAEHYIKARERGYVLYVEGGTDVDMLRALAERLKHPVAATWDERINSFYVQNNYPDKSLDSELERVEGGFGVTPRDHFKGLCNLLPQLKGLAVLDNDGRDRQGSVEGNLQLTYWRRYEAENYFVTPDVLRRYALEHFAELELFGDYQVEIEDVMDALLLEQVFDGTQADFEAWKQAPTQAARIVWEAKTQRIKLSSLAEEFFRRLSARVGGSMLLKKGELHRLVSVVDPKNVAAEVNEKLDLLHQLFKSAAQSSEASEPT